MWTNDDDSESHAQERYEMVFEDKYAEARDLLYNHPETFAEALELVGAEDKEQDFDFAKALMDNLKELPDWREQNNVLLSHAIVTRIRKAYEEFINAYAEALTREELGG